MRARLKEPLLIVYKGMYLARRTRSNALRKLSRLLGQREIIQEVIAQLTDCNGSLWAECNKRQNPPTPASADVLGRYTCISSHQLHRTNEPGILSMHMHPSKVLRLHIVIIAHHFISLWWIISTYITCSSLLSFCSMLSIKFLRYISFLAAHLSAICWSLNIFYIFLLSETCSDSSGGVACRGRAHWPGSEPRSRTKKSPRCARWLLLRC